MLNKLKKNYFLLISTFLVLYFFFNFLEGERGLFSYFKKQEILINLENEKTAPRAREVNRIRGAARGDASSSSLPLSVTPPPTITTENLSKIIRAFVSLVMQNPELATRVAMSGIPNQLLRRMLDAAGEHDTQMACLSAMTQLVLHSEVAVQQVSFLVFFFPSFFSALCPLFVSCCQPRANPFFVFMLSRLIFFYKRLNINFKSQPLILIQFAADPDTLKTLTTLLLSINHETHFKI